jgi:hypothetical protein
MATATAAPKRIVTKATEAADKADKAPDLIDALAKAEARAKEKGFTDKKGRPLTKGCRVKGHPFTGPKGQEFPGGWEGTVTYTVRNGSDNPRAKADTPMVGVEGHEAFSPYGRKVKSFAVPCSAVELIEHVKPKVAAK